jgi:hypothetical protein
MEQINGDIIRTLGGLSAGVRLREEHRTYCVVVSSTRLSVGIDSLVRCCKSSGGALRLPLVGEGVFLATFRFDGEGVFAARFLLAGDGVLDATLLSL